MTTASRKNTKKRRSPSSMDEPKGQAQRAASEANRRMQESTREAAKVVNTLADKGAQTTAALTEANQRVMNEFRAAPWLSRIISGDRSAVDADAAEHAGHDAREPGGCPAGSAGVAGSLQGS